MRTKRMILTRALMLASGLALTAVIAGCGSSSSASSSASATAPVSSSPLPAVSVTATLSATAEPASGAGAIASVRSNWTAFFSSSTPIDQRIALLENGQVFAPVIRAQAGNPLASAASAKVTSVTLTGPGRASVSYGIQVAGITALGGQKGVAVYQDGVWKVGDASFCGLLKVENGGKSTGLPAACPAMTGPA